MEQTKAMEAGGKMGFIYRVDHFRNGVLIDTSEDHNLIPTQGLNHALDVMLKAGVQITSWYVGIFEGNYTPIPAVTGATIVAAATECVAYAEATRPAWVGGAIANGFVTNDANRAAFTMNAAKAVYGGFLVSSPVKGGASDVIVSAVRFSTVKNVEAGDILRVRAEFTNISAT